MKLKLVVASMSVLGLVSIPLYAASTNTTQTTETTQTTQVKNTAAKHAVVRKHHRAMHHPRVMKQDDYKVVDTVAVQQTAVETEPKVDTYQAVLDAMSQNSGRAKSMPDWFNRVNVSGGTNVDFKWGNRTPRYTTENVQRIALNDLYLNVNATVNDWSKAFASLSYNSTSANYSHTTEPDTLNVEQAYVTLGNLDTNPLFLQVGKQYQDFGRYTIHPLNRTLTQSLSEALRTSANLGFVTKMGLHGSVSAFDNVVTVGSVGHPRTVFGAALGFDQPNDQLGYGLGVGYLSNMAGVNDVAYFLADHNSHNVGALALYGDVNSGPFNFGVRFTKALKTFSAADINNNAGLVVGADQGAKPWGADFTAGYGYNYMNRNQNIYVGYQVTDDAVRFDLPKHRILAGFGVDMWKNTNVGLEYTYDHDYKTSEGGSGENNSTFGVRAGVKFG